MNQSALAGAMVGGGTVTFAADGVIGLTSTIVVANNTVLDATGHNITIDGGNAVSLFTVNAGVNFVLTNLTLADGLAEGTTNLPGLGGAICNTGLVVAVQCVFSNNWAQGLADVPSYQGYSSPALGGAIYNTGLVVAVQCVFANNRARGYTNVVDDSSSAAFGGAIYNAGTLTLSNSIFASNSAFGGDGRSEGYYGAGEVTGPDPGQEGSGGAIYSSGNALVVNCQASGNVAAGGLGGAGKNGFEYATPGETGGPANGGAICSSGSLIVSNSTFMQNMVTGGGGGVGGDGPNLYGYGNGTPGAAGGAPGNGNGGAICCVNGISVVVNCTFWNNSSAGGTGGNGGTGGTGTVAFRGYSGGAGGNGANGGNGIGGAVCSLGGSLTLNYATIASNTVAGGMAGAGGQGGWLGYPQTPGPPGTNGAPGAGQGDSLGCTGATLTVQSCILAANAATDTNVFGAIVDAGYNLNSDAMGVLTSSTSLNNTNPELGAPGNYGGPTPTIPLLAGSPAMDAADPAAFPPTDQRGFPRPRGYGPDIGAFEFQSGPSGYTVSGTVMGCTLTNEITVKLGTNLVTTTTNNGQYQFNVGLTGTYIVTPVNTNYLFIPETIQVTVGPSQSGLNFEACRWNTLSLGECTNHILHLILASHNTGLTYRTLSSSNLVQWTPIATNMVGASHYYDVFVPVTNGPQQFFRTVRP